MSVITIVGAGMMGSAVCFPACDNGHEVRLVGSPLDREIIEEAKKSGYRIFADSTKLNLYIECSGKDALENLLVYLKENMISLINFEIAGKTDDSANTMAAVFQLKLPRTTQRTNASVIGAIKEISGILSIVEM